MPTSTIASSALPPEIDLAMCIYHSFSVHNPARARQALAEVLDRVDATDSMKIAKALVRALANKTPIWKQKRYPRTRNRPPQRARCGRSSWSRPSRRRELGFR